VSAYEGGGSSANSAQRGRGRNNRGGFGRGAIVTVTLGVTKSLITHIRILIEQ
jgi:hypothetical protein